MWRTQAQPVRQPGQAISPLSSASTSSPSQRCWPQRRPGKEEVSRNLLTDDLTNGMQIHEVNSWESIILNMQLDWGFLACSIFARLGKDWSAVDVKSAEVCLWMGEG